MERAAAIELIQTKELLLPQKSVWADLGCGSGLFTAALAHLLSENSTIYAIDKSPIKLDVSWFPDHIHTRTFQLDFVENKLDLPLLDGILMANSLHFVRDKSLLLSKLTKVLKPDGRFLLVEYDTDKPAAPWVPYPISFNTLTRFFAGLGYDQLVKLGERASIYRRAKMYAALISKSQD